MWCTRVRSAAASDGYKRQGRTGSMSERDAGNTHDANAIAVVPSGGERGLVGVVGYVPRELAMCLAPALDAGVVVISVTGIYSCPSYPSPSPRDRTRVRLPFFA